MDFEPHDQDIIGLLTRLKDTSGEYPEQMRVARRQRFLKHMAEIELGISGDRAGRKPAGRKKPPGASSTTGTLLQTVIIAALIAEASLMAYFYREQLADFFKTITTGPGIEQLTPAPVVPTPLEIQGLSPSAAVASTATAADPTAHALTPAAGSLPAAFEDQSLTAEINSTPVPNGNNGHHYGQTPKPERTKENNGNKDKPPKDDGNKPPKGKPPKSK